MDKLIMVIGFARYYLVPTAILLGVLIFVHEFGHFIIAKLSGVRVLKFSLGFGPKIIGKKVGDTEYVISVLPLGGYVKPLGESPDEPVAVEDQIGKRLAIIAAGSVFNIVFAWVLFTVIFMVGTPTLLPLVGKVIENSPAQRAGLKEGDLVLSVNAKEIALWDELSQSIEESGGSAMTLRIKRDGQILPVKIEPQISDGKDIFGQAKKGFKIGIVAATGKDAIMIKRFGPGEAVFKGLYQTWNISRLTLLSIFKIIGRTLPADSLGGPIRIAEIAGEFAEAGLVSFFSLMAIISVNLGVLNLLPIPILDGGHIFFILMEAVKGRPLSMKKMEIAQQIGLALIVMLMVFVFYNDIARLIRG
ncbi:MAG: RIP metalloprotease RseP [Proteobacteria bacterium]|nr:RIP metalloprotease RseP [Pseudomonadota bacterium]